MFAVAWLVLVLTGSGPASMEFSERAEPFASREACAAHVARYEARFHDYFRGLLNVSWEAEIAVKGECRPVGDPA